MAARYSPEELARFLQQIDEELQQPCRIVLIGGGAVGLAYHGTHATADLDLWQGNRDFWNAVERVQVREAALSLCTKRPLPSRRMILNPVCGPFR